MNINEIAHAAAHIPFPIKPATPKVELDEAEPQNIITVEFDREEYIVTAV
jgi:hypothetical protein